MTGRLDNQIIFPLLQLIASDSLINNGDVKQGDVIEGNQSRQANKGRAMRRFAIITDIKT